MTTRLPRSARGRALPASGDDGLTWPPVLRGRSPLAVVLLLGWLGGGLLATAVAAVAGGRADLVYGLTNTASACLGLLLLAAAGVRDGSRARRAALSQGAALPEPHVQPEPHLQPGPVPVPVQPHRDREDRRAPALR